MLLLTNQIYHPANNFGEKSMLFLLDGQMNKNIFIFL